MELTSSEHHPSHPIPPAHVVLPRRDPLQPIRQCSSPAEFFLEHAAEAVIFTDATGLVVHLNAAAERLIERNEGLAIQPDGVLGTFDKSSSHRLSNLIDQAAKATQGETSFSGDTVAIRRSRGRMPLLVSVSTLSRPLLSDHSVRQVSVMITFSDPDTPAPSLVDPVATVFGLTQAERRVVAGVLEGLKAREIAERLGNSINTVNTHVKRVYAKTGVRRHGDLIRLCMHLALSTHPAAGVGRAN